MRKLKKHLSLIVAAICVFVFSAGVSAADVYTVYTVEDGDTVSKIAKQYNIDTQSIVTATGLEDGGYWIYPGDQLMIDSNCKSNPNGNYTVKAGDTLSLIANAQGTTVEQLKSDNGLIADRIYIGQVLYVGEEAVTPTPTPPAGYRFR